MRTFSFLALTALFVGACAVPESETGASQAADLAACGDIDGGIVDSTTLGDHVFEVPAGQTLTFGGSPEIVRVNAYGFGSKPGPWTANKATVTIQQSVPEGTIVRVPYSVMHGSVDTQIGYFNVKVTAACKAPTPFVGVGAPVGNAAGCGDLGMITNVPEQLDGKTFDVEEGKALGYYLRGMPSLRQSESGSASWSHCSPFWADVQCFQGFATKPLPGVGSELAVSIGPEDSFFFMYEPSLHAKFTIRTVAAGSCDGGASSPTR